MAKETEVEGRDVTTELMASAPLSITHWVGSVQDTKLLKRLYVQVSHTQPLNAQDGHDLPNLGTWCLKTEQKKSTSKSKSL